MSDDTVEHRFIQIHQACENASTQGEDFWSTLALKSTSTIATSHVCEKIYNRVSNGEFDLLVTFQIFQNLITTCNEIPKNIVFLRVITRLLVQNPTGLSFDHVKHKSFDAVRKEEVDYQVHPFAVIMRQKPTLYFNILDEIDYMLVNFQPGTVLDALSGFIKAIFWTENNVDAGSLITRLTNNVDASTAEVHLSKVFNQAIKLVEGYPLHKDDQHYFLLLDWIIWLTNTAPSAFNTRQAYLDTSYSDSLIDRLLTAVTDGNYIIPHLMRLERILENLNGSNFHIAWSSLSYALLKTQTIEEQKSIIRIMIKTNTRNEGCEAIILRIAYIPLYQLLSELNDKAASKDLVELKKDVLNLIAFLDNAEEPLEDPEIYRNEVCLMY
jgi:hypothetical protein